jgi:hypothetical protein
MKPVGPRTARVARILAMLAAVHFASVSTAHAAPGHGGGGSHHAGGNGPHSHYGGYTWGGYYSGSYGSTYGVYPTNGGFAPVLPQQSAIVPSGFWISDGMMWWWVPAGF